MTPEQRDQYMSLSERFRDPKLNPHGGWSHEDIHDDGELSYIRDEIAERLAIASMVVGLRKAYRELRIEDGGAGYVNIILEDGSVETGPDDFSALLAACIHAESKEPNA